MFKSLAKMMIVRSILIQVVFRSIEHGNIFTERANDSKIEEPILICET
jgi:hypothetical protein